MTEPVVLLASTCWWHSAPRLALSLAEAGCRVAAIYPKRGHLLENVSAVCPRFSYSAANPIAALVDAISIVQPDLIVPCDDRVVAHLHRLHALAKAGASPAKLPARELMRIIGRSLGKDTGFSETLARYPLLELAGSLGIPVPQGATIGSPDELDHWVSQHGLPCVIKADGSWGGKGVRVAHTLADAHRARRELARPLPVWLALKRRIVNRDPFWLPEALAYAPRPVVVQSYIRGRPANCAVFCWKGRVLAGIAAETLQSREPTSPATVIRIVDHPDMLHAAALLAGRLQMSGFFGLDFMIEQGRGEAWLIEMNPRATPLCHLRLGPGRDLAAALYAELSGLAQPAAFSITQADVIAYFPAALEAGAGGAPAGAYHDIPSGEPGLVRELLRTPWPERGLIARLFSAARSMIATFRARRWAVTGPDTGADELPPLSGPTVASRVSHLEVE